MTTLSIFGEVKSTNSDSRLGGQLLTAVFGALDIDFTRHPLEPGDHYLRVIALFGKATLRIPDHVALSIEGINMFGKTETPPGANPATARVRLHLNAMTLFGAIEVVGAESVAEVAALEDESAAPYDGETRRLEGGEGYAGEAWREGAEAERG